MKYKMKKNIFIILLVFCISTICAVQVAIAPLNEITSEKTNISKKLSNDILKEIYSIWVGDAVFFKSLQNYEDVEINTILDASKVSSLNSIDYLLYGYIRKNDTSWYAEIKLFNKATQNNEELFFASDSIDQYERFIVSIAENIVGWFSDIYGIELEEVVPQESHMSISLPVRIGYWTYTGTPWTSLMLGTIDADVGAEFNPGFILPRWFSKEFDITFGLNIGYRLGVGNPNAYTSFLHGITITTPVYLHAQLLQRHGVYAGLGLLYEADILYIEEKYKSAEVYATHLIGTNIAAGYRWKINEHIYLTTGIDLDIYFSNNTPPVFRTKFGVVFPLWEKTEVIQ